MYLISAEGYTNTNVHFLKIRKTLGKYERFWRRFRR